MKQSRIRVLRNQAELNQEDVAKQLGLSTSQYSRIERKPEGATLGQLLAIAKVLGVTANELIDDAETNWEGAPLARLYRAVPVLKVEDLGARHMATEFIAPTVEVSPESFWLEIDNTDNAPLLEPGEAACFDPGRKPRPGAIVCAEDARTGEVVIGLYQPLHASSEDAPGFVVQPKNLPHSAARFSKKKKGNLRGTLVEKRQRF